MIFWIFVIGLFVGIGLIVLGSISWDYLKHHWLYYHDEALNVAGVGVALISGFVVLIMCLFLFNEHNGSQAELAVLREREYAIVYKLESGACIDEFGLLSKTVIDEVQDWNEVIIKEKKLQRNFWIGIFHANIYDEFETIDYKKYSTKQIK